MNERNLYRGQLAELNDQFKKIEILDDSLLTEIRMKLNPINEFTEFDVEGVFSLIETWRMNQLKGREILEKIDKLETLLGLK
ncbi:MAG: hypothetical protein AMXMBFR48_15400 [Ignavibacteriales bacterium]